MLHGFTHRSDFHAILGFLGRRWPLQALGLLLLGLIRRRSALWRRSAHWLSIHWLDSGLERDEFHFVRRGLLLKIITCTCFPPLSFCRGRFVLAAYVLGNAAVGSQLGS
jgi:hypothetical protein